MFHVSTKLPYTEGDSQQVKRQYIFILNMSFRDAVGGFCFVTGFLFPNELSVFGLRVSYV